MALAADRYGPAVCAESSRQIRHIRMINARPGARTGLLSTGRPLPAYLRRLEPAKRHVPYAMHTGCTRRAGSSRLASGTPPLVACACATMVIVRSDRDHSPEWLPLPACSNAPGVSCIISADPRAPGCPWATAVALLSHGHFTAAPQVELPMCRLCMGWPTLQPTTRAASARSGCIGSIMCPFVCDRSPRE